MGRDELNLAEFPIAFLAETAPPGLNVLEFQDRIFDKGRGIFLDRKLTVEGSEVHGLPTAQDDEVIVGLIQLSKRDRFDNRTLRFCRSDLIALLGWRRSGQSYARLELALRRWVSVTLHYADSWWDKGQEHWTSGAFHILDGFELNDGRESDARRDPLTSWITWNDRIFDSFAAGHLKNIRYDVYVALKTAISKRVYRFLDKRFHHARRCSFDLRDFAHEHIGLSRSYRDCGKLKEKLRPALAELEAIGFLEPAADGDRYRHEGRGRWRVTFTRADTKAAPATAAGEAEPADLAAELVRHGVTPATAEELTRLHPEDLIRRQVEYLDWLVEARPGKVGEPGGYLVDAIRMDYAAPGGFLPEAERRRRREEAAAADEARRLGWKRAAEEREVAAAIDAYRRAMTPEQAEAVTREAMAAAGDEERDLYATSAGAIRRMLLARVVDDHILRILRDRAGGEQ